VHAQTPVTEILNSSNETVLQLNDDGGLIAPGTIDTGTIPVEGPGTRLMWHPAQAAFRAGRVTGTQWNNANVGHHSVATGYNTTASGGFSTAMGFGTSASGQSATAMGEGTTAIGISTTAMGYQTTARGRYGTAMGSQTTVTGLGFAATAMGESTTATGRVSTAMGFNTTAIGEFSTAMGRLSRARAYASLVIGRHNIGAGLPTLWRANDPLFVAGNGTDDANRSNALVLEKDGDLRIAGDLTQNSDRRLKTNVEPLGDDVLGRLAAIDPVRYRFKPGTGHPEHDQIGLIAQEVEQAFPELVTRGADGYLSLAYPKMTAVLLKGLQEQHAQIEHQQAQIETLQQRMEALEQFVNQREQAALAGLTTPVGWGVGVMLLLGFLLWHRRRAAPAAH
jgi:hypothetical protein